MNAKLLVVDGDWTSLELITAVLTREGFDVKASRDGLDALSRFHDTSPVLVLCDEDLPVITVSEFMREVHKSGIETRVVLLSSEPSVDRREEVANELGCDATLARPFHYLELRALLDRLEIESPAQASRALDLEYAVCDQDLANALPPPTPPERVGVQGATADGTADVPPLPVPIPLPDDGAIAPPQLRSMARPSPGLLAPPPRSVVRTPPPAAKVEVESEAAEVELEAAEVELEAAEVELEAVEVESEAPEVESEAVEVESEAVEVESEAVEVELEAVEVESEAVEVEAEPIAAVADDDDAPEDIEIDSIAVTQPDGTAAVIEEALRHESLRSEDLAPEIRPIQQDPYDDEDAEDIELDDIATTQPDGTAAVREQAIAAVAQASTSDDLVDDDVELSDLALTQPDSKASAIAALAAAYVAEQSGIEEEPPELPIEPMGDPVDEPTSTISGMTSPLEEIVDADESAATELDDPTPNEDESTAVTPLPPHLAARGALNRLPLPRLMFELYLATFTGVLRLSRQGVERSIYFVGGLPVRVDSQQLNENLGRLLVDSGRIAPAQYADAQELVRTQGLKQGQALIQLGALNEAGLLAALAEQTEEKLVNSLSWLDGEYVIEPGEAFISDSVINEVSPIRVIWRGVTEYYEPSSLLQYFSGMADRYAVATDQFAIHYQSLEEELSALNIPRLLDGKLTLGRILSAEPARSGPLAQAFYVLLVTDMMRPSEAPGEPARLPEPRSGQRPQSATDEAFLEDLASTYLRVKDGDYFVALSVAQNATPEQVESAFAAIVSRLRLEQLPDELDDGMRRRGREIRDIVRRARNTLTDPGRRDAYLAQRQESQPAPEASDPSTSHGVPREDALVAEEAFARGIQALGGGDAERSLGDFRIAIEKNPSEPSYRVALGRALLAWTGLADPAARQRAMTCFQQALSLDPGHESANLHLAEVLVAERLPDHARACLNRVLRRNPNHPEARRMILTLG